MLKRSEIVYLNMVKSEKKIECYLKIFIKLRIKYLMFTPMTYVIIKKDIRIRIFSLFKLGNYKRKTFISLH